MQLYKKALLPTQRKMFNQYCLIPSKYHNKRRKSENLKTKIYYGASETVFKLRYANHKKRFNNIKYLTDTELSNEYWNIIAANKTSNISWEILGTQKSYSQSSKRCLLCLNEKLAIALHKGDNILKKRSEIISKCRYRNKYRLASYDSKD